MKLKNIITDKQLYLKIKGRLDIEGTTIFESILSNLSNIGSIIFDFEEVDYISSSGLKIVLKCKKQVENTLIINCNDLTYEIFEMTGFTDIINIGKISKNKIKVKY